MDLLKQHNKTIYPRHIVTVGLSIQDGKVYAEYEQQLTGYVFHRSVTDNSNVRQNGSSSYSFCFVDIGWLYVVRLI